MFGCIPSTAFSANDFEESANNFIDSKILWAITGLKTFNSKFPLAPAMVIVTSFPKT